MDKKPLAVIVGSTAVGKTQVSLLLAKALSAEIVSADSMQIYKNMDIGTAKPSHCERSLIQHHLVDFWDPASKFSVVQFRELAIEKVNDIHIRDKLPILVGGTGLYVNSLVYPMNFTAAGYDYSFRQLMQGKAEMQNEDYLYCLLKEIDPLTASRLNQKDTRRIIRALEVHYLTGKPMSEYRQDFEAIESNYRTAIVGLNMSRSKLYEIINRRVDLMIENGLEGEVRSLIEKGCHAGMQSMQGLGYKQIIEHIEGKTSLPEAIDSIKRNTRRYAKRQLTWFRRDKRIYWLDVDDFESREELVDYIETYIRKILYANN